MTTRKPAGDARRAALAHADKPRDDTLGLLAGIQEALSPELPPLSAALTRHLAVSGLGVNEAARVAEVSPPVVSQLARGVYRTWNLTPKVTAGLSRLLGVPTERVTQLAQESATYQQASGVSVATEEVGALLQQLTTANVTVVRTVVLHLLEDQTRVQRAEQAARLLVRVVLESADNPAVAQRVGQLLSRGVGPETEAALLAELRNDN